ncbi:receptor-like protein 9DC3 [Lycium ferocissimum]|uniref:receptor-like protein 9DC3 n=1 Tax=Lycium ferocissimum TaxID=112874 RepID=UPI00281616A4|nr:receptor-like protein 9DC3 [Lycium ferocissimum]
MGIEKLALFMLYAFLCQLAFSSSLPHLCRKDQAHALLQFKQTFTTNSDASGCSEPYAKTLSWNRSADCCSWDGVHCDEMTGQVIELDLSCSQLQGKFHSNNSLFQLSNLKKLDLSYNDFSGSHLSPKFGEFSGLTHLDLWGSSFTGQIPSEISYLSKLHVLSIWSEDPYMLRFGPHTFELLLKNLTQLRELELYDVNISSTIPQNFSSYLTTLQLLNTQLCGILPERVLHLSNLELLDLSYNTQLTVRLPMTKWNSSTSLMNLYLCSVKFTGNLPESMSYLTSLHDLDMSSGNLSGLILKPLWNLTNIENLFLEINNLEGTISPFFKFGKLRGLKLWGNNFSGSIPSNVSGLQNLQSLVLSSNHLSGTIPSWIFSLPSLSWLYLSDNNFSGKIQEFKSQTLIVVTLEQNQLEGPIPKSLLNQQSLGFLHLSQNNFSGQISSTICNLKTLIVLDLGSNNLNGTIPQFLGEINEHVRVFDLSNNSLSGTINTTFSVGNQLSVIKLHGNKLEGKVPRSLINCKYLELLDLGDNELNDTFPKWLGTLPNLKLLSLRSNKLHGPIKASKNKKLFAQLQIMDLSSNGFSGNLPESLFDNFQAMKIIDKNARTPWYVGDQYGIFYDSVMTITTKGLDFEFARVLTTNMVINLSRNRFEGYIPSTIASLLALRTLNLSHNGLEGLIPASLQHLSVLESLDLSFNKIGGEIPQQLASLTSLEVLNLSHNHLVGCIPKGKQFDTFEKSSYQGNDGLHGFPLSKDCGGDNRVPQATTPFVQDLGEEGDSSPISWQAVLMGYGCGLIIGLSMVYIMLSTQNPAWFSRMFEELERIINTRMQKQKKRN